MASTCLTCALNPRCHPTVAPQLHCTCSCYCLLLGNDASTSRPCPHLGHVNQQSKASDYSRFFTNCSMNVAPTGGAVVLPAAGTAGALAGSGATVAAGLTGSVALQTQHQVSTEHVRRHGACGCPCAQLCNTACTAVPLCVKPAACSSTPGSTPKAFDSARALVHAVQQPPVLISWLTAMLSKLPQADVPVCGTAHFAASERCCK